MFTAHGPRRLERRRLQVSFEFGSGYAVARVPRLRPPAVLVPLPFVRARWSLAAYCSALPRRGARQHPLDRDPGPALPDAWFALRPRGSSCSPSRSAEQTHPVKSASTCSPSPPTADERRQALVTERWRGTHRSREIFWSRSVTAHRRRARPRSASWSRQPACTPALPPARPTALLLFSSSPSTAASAIRGLLELPARLPWHGDAALRRRGGGGQTTPPTTAARLSSWRTMSPRS